MKARIDPDMLAALMWLIEQKRRQPVIPYGRCSPRVCPSSTIVFANYRASVKPVFCSAACEIAKRHVSGEPKKETP